jgi:hypothetical protein
MRYHNWPERLHVIVAERKDVPFARGTQDCCMFAADVVLEITGVDFAEGFRGTYADDKGALRLSAQLGGVRKLAGSKLGAEIHALQAQRGDVALIDGEHGESLTVCMGSYVVGTGTNGLIRFPLSSAICAWRVK